MVKRRKLLVKATTSRNLRFDELTALVDGFGFILKRISGSHHIYKHPDVPEILSLQPDKNGQAKPYQVRTLLRMVEEYALTLKEEE
ncbi:MAG: type II toxin-antitoxin system HicA family toxin [Chloroflexi bacterium]|nr:type II toxin-antitoxin system HicA family toxin [Chloroflexota bacterium]